MHTFIDVLYCTIVVQLFYIIEIYENVYIISIQITVLTMTEIHLIKIPYYFKSLVTTRIVYLHNM